MNNYEDWAHLVAKKLKGEADVLTAIEKDELDDAAATDAFVRAVLKPFLPENFGVGSGRIVDAYGNRSDHLDVVIYNRNFPRIGLRGTQPDYLFESVLAAFCIRAKYIRKTFFDSMDACASLAQLDTNVDKEVLIRLAKRNGLRPGPNRSFVHDDPMRTARFELIGRPPVFMFGFTGIKGSSRQLQENVELWIEHRQQEQLSTPMRAFPAVIATQGCFAWRNAAPLSLSNREMMGIGNDEAPIRLIVLHLLHLLNRRLNVTSDGYGLKPNLRSYLSQFSPPEFELGAGAVDELVQARLPQKNPRQNDEKQAYEPARDHARKPADAKPPAQPVRKAAAAASAATPKPAGAAAQEEHAAQSPGPGGVFNKPSPFAAAPANTQTGSSKAPESASPRPAPTLGSAPIPSAQSPREEPGKASRKPPAAPPGSAPIPSTKPATPTQSKDAIPPKPPVDIELTGEHDIADGADANDEDVYDSTVVIKPDASLSRKPVSSNSTDAFIARVKEQLSSSDSSQDEEEKSFTSTVPQ